MFCTACSGSKSGSIDNPTMNLLIEGGYAEARYNVKSMRRLGSKRERERERERWTDKRRESSVGYPWASQSPQESQRESLLESP